MDLKVKIISGAFLTWAGICMPNREKILIKIKLESVAKNNAWTNLLKRLGLLNSESKTIFKDLHFSL